MVRLATFAFPLVALVALSALPADASSSYAYRYLLGTAAPDVLPTHVYPGGFCYGPWEDPSSPGESVGLGGVCGIPVQPGLVTVRVVPDAGATGFFLTGASSEKETIDLGPFAFTNTRQCIIASGEGEITLDLPDDCVSISVYLDAGAVSGTIFVARA